MARRLLPIFFIIVLSTCAFSQGNDKVDVFTKVSNPVNPQTCSEITLGGPIESITPVYPAEARSRRLGGAVRVEVLVNTEGKVVEITKVTGESLLTGSARAAALATRFTPSHCNNNAVEVPGVLVYNFVPLALKDFYVRVEKMSRYSDVSAGSRYFEPVLALTENYNLTFGYADGNFHPDAPLTKGDFAHFLRLTLDLLQKRAEISQKIPREIDLYFASNVNKLSSSKSIIDFDSRNPYSDSLTVLISKYDIALTDERNNFRGNLPLTYNEVTQYWKTIFGKDTLPVNFEESKDIDRIISRGEFALFLYESLYVLTYKVLP